MSRRIDEAWDEKPLILQPRFPVLAEKHRLGQDEAQR